MITCDALNVLQKYLHSSFIKKNRFYNVLNNETSLSCMRERYTQRAYKKSYECIKGRKESIITQFRII